MPKLDVQPNLISSSFLGVYYVDTWLSVSTSKCNTALDCTGCLKINCFCLSHFFCQFGSQYEKLNYNKIACGLCSLYFIWMCIECLIPVLLFQFCLLARPPSQAFHCTFAPIVLLCVFTTLYLSAFTQSLPVSLYALSVLVELLTTVDFMNTR